MREIMHTEVVTDKSRGLGANGASHRQNHENDQKISVLHFAPSPAAGFSPEYWKTWTRRLNESTT